MQIEQTEDSRSVLERLIAYAEIREKEGIFPYEGQWLTVDEINDRISRKETGDRTRVLEVGLLFTMVYVVAGLSYLLISLLCY